MRKLFLLSLLALALPGVSHAYYEYTTGGTLSAQVTPAVPLAGDKVTINLNSYSDDLAGATIIWTSNGKEVDRGTGHRSFSFTMPTALGAISTITAIEQTLDGRTITKNLGFQANDVALLWSANTTSQPIFAGHSRLSPQSSFIISALPEAFDLGGKKIPSSNLIFTWYVDGLKMADSSGAGKNQALAQIGSNPSGISVRVDVSTLSGDSKASRTIIIPLSLPQVLLYPIQPLLGVLYQRTLQDKVTVTGTGLSLAATPYYFSGTSSQGITFTWQAGNEPATPDPTNSSLISFERSNTSGAIPITATAHSPSNQFQTAQASLTAIIP